MDSTNGFETRFLGKHKNPRGFLAPKKLLVFCGNLVKAQKIVKDFLAPKNLKVFVELGD